jgi:uncharacterized protein YdcH (DUF465 family)
VFHEFRDLMDTLNATDPHFRSLYDKHEALDEKIARLDARVEPATDLEIEVLKKEKLLLKDQIYEILKKAIAARG